MDFEVRVNTEVIKADNSVSVRSLLYQFNKDVSTRVFRLQITDPDDPLFLYDYELSTSKYQDLKREQYIACEFINFPHCFYELLLLNNKETETRKAVIDEHNSPLLMLQQNTGFRLLIHLQLHVKLASDTRLKEYLAGEAKKYKSLYFEAKKGGDEFQKRIRNEKEKYENQILDLKNQLNDEQQKFEAAKQKLELSANQKIQQFESELIQAKQNLDQGYTVREQGLIEKYEKKVEDLRQKNIALLQEKHNAELISQRNYEKINSQEQKIAELLIKIKDFEKNNGSNTSKLIEQTKEINEYQNEIRCLKDKLISLQQVMNEKAAILNSQGNAFGNLQAELNSKNNQIDEMKKEMERLYKVEEEKNFISQKALHFFQTQKERENKLKDICAKKDEYISQLEQELNKYEYDCRNSEEKLNAAISELNAIRDTCQKLRDNNTKLQITNDNLKSDLKACEETKKMIEDELNRQHAKHFKQALLDDEKDLLASEDEDDDKPLLRLKKLASGKNSWNTETYANF